MIRKQLSPNPMPHWLAEVNEDSNFDRRAVLDNSIYYPGCDIDASPIEAYGGFAHSFVYVDYYCDKETVLKKLSRFGGYEPVFVREIKEDELSENSNPTISPRVTDFYGAHPEDSTIGLAFLRGFCKWNHPAKVIANLTLMKGSCTTCSDVPTHVGIPAVFFRTAVPGMQ